MQQSCRFKQMELSFQNFGAFLALQLDFEKKKLLTSRAANIEKFPTIHALIIIVEELLSRTKAIFRFLHQTSTRFCDAEGWISPTQPVNFSMGIWN